VADEIFLKNWFVARPVTGFRAIPYSIIAVAFPTIIRIYVSNFVMGCDYSAYIPFVLLSAAFLGWKYAAVITIVDVIVLDALFLVLSHRHLGITCDVIAIVSFFATSAAIIAFVEWVRELVKRDHGLAPSDDRRRGIIFSLEAGEALASWPGSASRLRLGPQDEVAEMMADFLMQREVGRRLTSPSLRVSTVPLPRNADDLLLILGTAQPEGTPIDYNQLCRERWGDAALPILQFQLGKLADRHDVIWAGGASSLVYLTKLGRQRARALRQNLSFRTGEWLHGNPHLIAWLGAAIVILALLFLLCEV
jgi:hypothetical protein